MSAEESAAWCAVIKVATPPFMMLVIGCLFAWWMWLACRKED
jgi:hypothetical protein